MTLGSDGTSPPSSPPPASHHHPSHPHHQMPKFQDPSSGISLIDAIQGQQQKNHNKRTTIATSSAASTSVSGRRGPALNIDHYTASSAATDYYPDDNANRNLFNHDADDANDNDASVVGNNSHMDNRMFPTYPSTDEERLIMSNFCSDMKSRDLILSRPTDDNENNQHNSNATTTSSSTNAEMTNRNLNTPTISHGSYSSSATTTTTTTNTRPKKRPRLESTPHPLTPTATQSSFVDSLETQLSKSASKQHSLMIENQNSELTIRHLQRQLDTLKKKSAQQIADLRDEKETALQKQQQQSQAEIHQLRLQLQQAQGQASQLENSHQSYQKQLQDWSRRVDELKEEKRHLEERLEKGPQEQMQRMQKLQLEQHSQQKQHEIDFLTEELRETQNQVQQLKSENDALSSQSKLREELSSELEQLTQLRSQVKKLHAENATLSQQAEKVLLLQEQNRKLNQQLDDNHERDHEIIQFLNEYDRVKGKIQLWEDTFGTSDPTQACQFMKQLQEENQQLLSDLEKVRVHHEALQEENKSLTTDHDRLTKHLFSQESELEKFRSTVEQQKNQIFLLEQEKDSTSEILKTFDREQDDAHQKRIQELESQLQSLRERCNKLEESNKDIEAKKQEALSEQRNVFMEEVSRLKKNFQEEQRQKIVHLRLNPQVEASSSKSSNELVRLRSQVKVLEERLRQSSISEHTSHLLAQKQEEFSKRIQRHNEVFREKISEFRRAMYLLCGYRVDVLDDHQYKLSSMFAEQKDDYLLFHFEADTKQMSLIETPFASSLQNDSSHEDALRYLQQLNSIPCFTSQLTVDLFSKQTIFPSLNSGGSGKKEKGSSQ